MVEFAPPLPDVFDESSEWALDEPIGDVKVIVFGGVPGSGKSTLAEALGAELGIHVVALDWILGAFTIYRALSLPNAGEFAYELALRQGMRELLAGRSVILDGIARQLPPSVQDSIVERWQSLAAARKASFYAIDCVCSDGQLHRSRMDGRRRGIPGWKQTVEWRHVVENAHNRRPWTFDHLLIDSVETPEKNLERILGYVR